MAAKTYRIVRYFQREGKPNEVLRTGVTMEEAKRHCQDPETSSSTCTSEAAKAITAAYGIWFDGWTEE